LLKLQQMLATLKSSFSGKFANKVTIKDLTTPQTLCYTTQCNNYREANPVHKLLPPGFRGWKTSPRSPGGKTKTQFHQAQYFRRVKTFSS